MPRGSKGRKKPQSLRRLLLRWLGATVAVCIGISLLYGVQLAWVQRKNLLDVNQEALRNYAVRFEDALGDIRGFSQSISINNIQFRTLSQSNCTDQQRLLAEYELRELLSIQTPDYGASLLYNSATGRTLFYYGDSMEDRAKFLEQASFMHDLGEMIAREDTYVYDQWFLYQAESPLLLLVNHYGSQYLCSVVDLSLYLQENVLDSYSSESAAVIYTEGRVLLSPAGALGEAETALLGADSGNGMTAGNIVCWQTVTGCPVGVALVTPTAELLQNFLPGIVVFVTILATVGAFMCIMWHTLDRSLLFPLQEIAVHSARLAGEEVPAPLESAPDFLEYDAIRSALDQLVQQKNALEAQYYASQQQKEHALLQYFQLQTRSHFMINCLKSLYSMSESGNPARMQAMIIAFSNHLRYVFRDNLQMVTLAEEIKELMDYHRIVTLDFPMPFLINQNVPKELQDVLVPPLILQTFLENTYKHADRAKGMLVFQIDISTVRYQEADYVRIHLSDNGGGYAPEVLETINADLTDEFSDYHVGINNLRHRMSLLYNGDYHTAFYNEENGSAHSVLYVPILRRQQ